MSDQVLSRRKFLAGAGAAIGLAALPAIVSSPAPAMAAVPDAQTWKYAPLDAETIGRRAYELYYKQGGCAEATWYPIIEALSTVEAADGPTTWATLPKKMFAFGGGGIAGWGTICGTCNGSSAIIKMVGAPNSIVDAIMLYYAETPLPTNGIDKAARAGWVPVSGASLPLENVPTCTAHTQLCHASLTKWMMTSGAADGSREQKDRCAKACYDMAKRTVELLNAWYADKANFNPGAVLHSSVASCGSNEAGTGCHKTKPLASKSKMGCPSCHEEGIDHLSD